MVVILLIADPTTSWGSENLARDPIQIMNQNKPSIGARGIVFVENISSGTSIGWIRYSHTPSFKADGSIDPKDYWDWKPCKSWSDSACPIKNGYTLEGKVILGPCITNEELGCLNNFKIFNSFGAGMTLTYLGSAFKEVIDTPESSELGIPRSSSPPVYSDSEGNLYIVRASLWVNITGTSKPSVKLDVDVTPVMRVNDNNFSAPKVTRQAEPRTGLGNVIVMPSPSECISTGIGVCYKAITPRNDYKYSVSVRIPRSINGWLRGRVSEPNFDVQLISDKSQLITVTAKAVKIPIAGGWAKYSDLPSGFIESIWPSGGYDSNPNSAYFLIANPSQGDQGMREYVAWTPYLNEKAIATLTNWSFGTNMGTEQACLNSPGEISGFVASNSSVYSSRPPEWDGTTSTLTYKVAAPHFDENGKENSGSYTLAMPLSSIKCLYGQNNLPPSATVSIAYGNEVINVATVTLKSDSGWIYFAANGFHYSNPTIQVKFGEATAIVSPLPKPSSTTPTPTASSSAPAASTVKKIQWCAKGYAKRKVTAVNPVCPKGYKKIADPTLR